MKKLSDYYKSLPDRESLVGLRVYHYPSDSWVYIKNVDNGLWCVKNPDDEYGNFYRMDDLEID